MTRSDGDVRGTCAEYARARGYILRIIRAIDLTLLVEI